MISAPLPSNEKERLQDLQELELLDTAVEASYDKITKLAAEICEVPICLISLIDKERQWFKSHHGLDATETPREYAFCAHAILGDDVFSVPNALEDERFADNPLVTGDPKVIFYAGTVLKSDKNNNLGTLCVIDHKPKELTDFQKEALQTLGEQISMQFSLRRHLKKLKKAHDNLAEEDAEKTKFFASVSHDVRSAMNGITGCLQMMLEEGVNQQQHEYIEASQKCSRTILEILNDILDVSKINAGTLELQEQIFDISQTLLDVVQIFQKEVRDKKLTTKVNISADVPQYLIGDALRYKQILINLISNAVKFTEEGTIHISLEGKAEANRKFHLITTIEDSGVGIEAEKLNDLFEPYQQAKAGQQKGTGLGLYICKRLAEAFNGSISVSSAEGKGSTFTFDILLSDI